MPRPKKEGTETEKVLDRLMTGSRKYQKSLDKSTKQSREVYLIDPELEVFRVPGPEKLYGKDYEIEMVACRVETRYD